VFAELIRDQKASAPITRIFNISGSRFSAAYERSTAMPVSTFEQLATRKRSWGR